MGVTRLMKYKVGDRVRIKEDLKYWNLVEKCLIECNYILTIIAIKKDYIAEDCYIMKNIEYKWKDKHIKERL